MTVYCPFVRDYLGGPAPEETFTHSHPSFVNFLHLKLSIACSLFNFHALQSFSTTSVVVIINSALLQ